MKETVKLYLEKVQHHMKKWTDCKRRFHEFKEGDQVLVKLYQYGCIRGVHNDLMRQYE